MRRQLRLPGAARLVQDAGPGRKDAVTELQAVLDRGLVDSRDGRPRGGAREVTPKKK
ncbi:hypothetical protein ACIOEW_12490 [Streptomyces sp. NPDC087901]|uniref:hypothetical protein n=1 Tax=unclassified Streptomyces TaxID=2593676 RepID=UPI003439FC0E